MPGLLLTCYLWLAWYLQPLIHFAPQNKQNPTFKDNDFTKDIIKLVVGEEAKKNLLEILKGDVEVSCT